MSANYMGKKLGQKYISKYEIVTLMPQCDPTGLSTLINNIKAQYRFNLRCNYSVKHCAWHKMSAPIDGIVLSLHHMLAVCQIAAMPGLLGERRLLNMSGQLLAFNIVKYYKALHGDVNCQVCECFLQFYVSLY